MLESLRKSPLKLGIIIVVFALLNVVGWYAYLNWDTPLGEPLNLPTATDQPLAGLTLTETPLVASTEEISATETPEIVFTPTIGPVCGNRPSMTILIAGIDSKSYLFGLADSIRIVRFDFQNKKVTVLAIPRDLWVDIPVEPKYGVDQGKINQAYFYGSEGMGFYDGTGYGSGLLASTLMENFGLYIDHYLSVNLHAFENIIDALGGLNIYLPENIYIKHFNQPKLYLRAGTHHLTGKQAEHVVRTRIGIGDFGRIKNQTMVLNSLILQMITPAGIKKLPEIIESLIANTFTDLSPEDITKMLCLAARIDNKEDIIYQNVISNHEEEESGRWVMDEFQGFKVFALLMDNEVLTQRLADFQTGIWP